MPRTGHIEIQPDANGETRWRIRAANGKVLADSGEGYIDPADAHAGLQLVADILGGHAMRTDGHADLTLVPLEYLDADGNLLRRTEARER